MGSPNFSLICPNERSQSLYSSIWVSLSKNLQSSRTGKVSLYKMLELASFRRCTLVQPGRIIVAQRTMVRVTIIIRFTVFITPPSCNIKSTLQNNCVYIIHHIQLCQRWPRCYLLYTAFGHVCSPLLAFILQNPHSISRYVVEHLKLLLYNRLQ